MEISKCMKIPKIRFKGFEEEWNIAKIKEIAKFSKGNGYSKADLTQQGTPIILYGHMYTQYKSVITSVNHYVKIKPNSVLSDGNEVIIPSSGETPEDISIASAICKSNIIIGGDLNILRFNDEILNKSFAAISISYSKTHKELSRYAQGKTIVHLRNNDIAKGHITYPSLNEQRLIVLFIETIETQIQATSKKLASLKQIKAASLQSMFPQEGETVPKVRFKGFEGEWEEKSFSALYKKSIIKNDLTFGTDKIISVANMYYLTNVNVSDLEYLKTYNIMKLGDIAFEGNKSKRFLHGRFVENTIGDGIVSHVFVVFHPISAEHDINYWKYAINNENIMRNVLIRCTKSSTMMTDLVVNDFLKETILVPSYAEQQKIGAYFRNLDQQISLQTQRLEKIKQIKAACLDKMFV
jgi:hypothetical protein